MMRIFFAAVQKIWIELFSKTAIRTVPMIGISWLIQFYCLGASSTALSADIFSGYYTTAIPESYYDSIIRVQRSLDGKIVGLTEQFLVEGVPTRPYAFSCEKDLCVNHEKPYWTITLVSDQEYEDRYNSMHFRYVLASPLPDNLDR